MAGVALRAGRVEAGPLAKQFERTRRVSEA